MLVKYYEKNFRKEATVLKALIIANTVKKTSGNIVRTFLKKESKIQPEFSEDECHSYFRNSLKVKNRNKKFTSPPPCMKQLPAPNVSFDNEPPTYKKIMKIIMKMKSSGSPCAQDQISMIVLKQCPILRTYIWKIIEFCWKNKYFPTVWKNSITILVYKKLDPANDLANFGRITLEPVIAKVFTSLIRNCIYGYISKNNYIDSHIQKDFWQGISGTVEHTTELMSYFNRSCPQ